MNVRYPHFPKVATGCRLCRVPATRDTRAGFIVRRETDGAQLFPATGVCEDEGETEAVAAAIRAGIIEEVT